MERVILLVEATGSRIPCLLNPESLEIRRWAGITVQAPGISSAEPGDAADAPLAATGGGRTEWQLDLLFDVDLAGAHATVADERWNQALVRRRMSDPDPQSQDDRPIEDVRQLTAPLFALAETARSDAGRLSLPLVRVIWGKRWNLPGVVAAVAQRLERFAADGAPRRSWLRMRFLRVAAPISTPPVAPPPEPADAVAVGEALGQTELTTVRVGDSERLDLIAARIYGDPGYWRVIAAVNDLADPQVLLAGTVLRLPTPEAVERTRLETTA